jgi:hypothetical protein
LKALFQRTQQVGGYHGIPMAAKSNTGNTIDKVETTSDTLSGRGGLSLFIRYLSRIQIYLFLERLYGSIRKNAKGQLVAEMYKQVFCFLVDGTSLEAGCWVRRQYRDGARDPAVFPAVKRFFNACSYYRIWLFRALLKQLFLWRLQLQKPEVIEQGLDTMVMDNDAARKRQGIWISSSQILPNHSFFTQIDCS